MLVLGRKIGQSIVLDDNIEITVTRIGNNRVSIGISAPQDVFIRRGELIEWEQEEPPLRNSRESAEDRSQQEKFEACVS